MPVKKALSLASCRVYSETSVKDLFHLFKKLILQNMYTKDYTETVQVTPLRRNLSSSP